MKTAFSLWWELQKMPLLDWVQIEVTSRCNAFCRYCPRTLYSGPEKDISPEAFHALVPYFATTRLVHLQGWGEPLLHPGFFQMIDSAKKSGCRVSTATNGSLLDRENATRLVESGIDELGISLAGIGSGNDEVRKGTKFEDILQAISEMHSAKQRLRSENPTVNIAYMLLRSQANSLPDIVPALERTGIESVIISTLDFVPSGDLATECIAPDTEDEYREWRSRLERAAEDGKQARIAVHYRLSRPQNRGRSCPEKPENALVVSAEGTVHPCVFTNNAVMSAERICFGSLEEETLSAIWTAKPYASFRRSFRKRPDPHCLSCRKLGLA